VGSAHQFVRDLIAGHRNADATPLKSRQARTTLTVTFGRLCGAGGCVLSEVVAAKQEVTDG
jgi:hypothetical protein